MEIDELKIRTSLTKKLLEVIVRKYVKKKLNLNNLELNIKDISISSTESGKTHIDACFSADISMNELLKIVMNSQ